MARSVQKRAGGVRWRHGRRTKDREPALLLVAHPKRGRQVRKGEKSIRIFGYVTRLERR